MNSLDYKGFARMKNFITSTVEGRKVTKLEAESVNINYVNFDGAG